MAKLSALIAAGGSAVYKAGLILPKGHCFPIQGTPMPDFVSARVATSI